MVESSSCRLRLNLLPPLGWSLSMPGGGRVPAVRALSAMIDVDDQGGD
jgi:hypothetical protein